ncbi:class I tRNA ligase family protein [Candidatus Carsonella ruddii]|uniref:valine--tRNA ligase n=1 Tax=Candidatus Carsonella ruddii PC isolate NHV TaxID=1202540 RepID=J3Z254_CARRU|nr:class I tRNA ligase family protein [Candidatus Carsonella ruddii]AFP84339.1 putative valyl-tRNA synthetase [Candidatus Carsonella ruddii PC isolate NHV]
MHRKNFIVKKTFSILLPPPNITGELHIGHFYQYFIIDFILKWKLIQGYKITTKFGFDHAGISTIIKFKKKNKIFNFVKKLKINFFKKMYFINFIFNKKIEFTLNNCYKKITRKIFFFLFKNDIIYVKKKNINFDFKLKSTISDSEIYKKVYKKFLFLVKYKFNNLNIIIPVSNILSIITDTGIIINNKINTNFNILTPFKIKVKIIKKNNLNKFKFRKISPIFYNKDYLLSVENKINIITFLTNKKKVKLLNYKYFKNVIIENKKIKNYKIKEMFLKKNVLKYLFYNNYIVCIKKIKSYTNINKKNNSKIFYLLIDQWYLKIKKVFSIKKIIKKIIIIPKKYNKLLNNWVINLSDWCISRQINWGLKIPILIDKEKFIYLKKISRIENYKNLNEVLDTWFNSSIWSIYIYSKNKKKQNILISGFDIIFFWILKMIIINLFCFKKIFLNKILLHGIIKDYKNRKISKSYCNSIPFKKLKNKINKYKNIFINNISSTNVKIVYKNKNINFFLNKNKAIFNNNLILHYFYFYKFKLIKNFENFNNIKNKNIINKNFLSKKIYLKLLCLDFPIKNKILINKWNFTINYLTNYKIKLNFYFIIKIFKKKYLIKKNYFAIFNKIIFIVYAKYKNKFI